eukprot:6213523-Pleurochrysis_carterae.AAC.1
MPAGCDIVRARVGECSVTLPPCPQVGRVSSLGDILLSTHHVYTPAPHAGSAVTRSQITRASEAR